MTAVAAAVCLCFDVMECKRIQRASDFCTCQGYSRSVWQQCAIMVVSETWYKYNAAAGISTSSRVIGSVLSVSRLRSKSGM